MLALILRFPPQPATAEPERRAATRPAAGASSARVATVTEVVKITPYATEAARTNAPVLPNNVPYVIGNVNSVPPDIGGIAGPKVSGVPGGHDTSARRR